MAQENAVSIAQHRADCVDLSQTRAQEEDLFELY